MLRILLVSVFVSALCFCSLQASELRVTDVLGKETIVSQLVLTEKHIELSDQQLPLGQVTSIELTEASLSATWQTWTHGLLLQDGSWLAMSALVAGNEEDVVQVASPFGVLQIPLEYVAAWGSYEELPKNAEYDYLILKNGNKPYG